LLCFASLRQNFLLCGGIIIAIIIPALFQKNKMQKQLERTLSVLGSLLTRDVLLFAKLLRSYLIKEPAGLYFPSTCREIPLPCFRALRRRFKQRSKIFLRIYLELIKEAKAAAPRQNRLAWSVRLLHYMRVCPRKSD